MKLLLPTQACLSSEMMLFDKGIKSKSSSSDESRRIGLDGLAGDADKAVDITSTFMALLRFLNISGGTFPSELSSLGLENFKSDGVVTTVFGAEGGVATFLSEDFAFLGHGVGVDDGFSLPLPETVERRCFC